MKDEIRRGRGLYTLQEAKDFLFSDKIQVVGDFRNVFVERRDDETDQEVADAIKVTVNAFDFVREQGRMLKRLENKANDMTDCHDQKCKGE